MRVAADLAFAEPVVKPHRPRAPRVASEKSDIDHLLRALGLLCDLVTTDVLGMPGSAGPARQYPLLRQAIWTARTAAYRVEKNKALRAKKKSRA